jgi:hypothetical protein
MTKGLFDCLDLEHNRTRYRTHGIGIKLNPHVTGESAFQFTLGDVEEVPLDLVEEWAGEKGFNETIQQAKEAAQTKNDQAGGKYITGYAILLCPPLARVCPLGIEAVAVDENKTLPYWKSGLGELLIVCISTLLTHQ